MKSIAKINIYRFAELDGFEIKQATFLNKHFPKHCHTQWSLGRILIGSENIQIANKKILLLPNSTILIPPFSVHSNWGNSNLSWKYQSIYLNEDFVKYIAEKNGLDYYRLLSQPYFLAYNLPQIFPTSFNYIHQIETVLKLIFKNETSTTTFWVNNELIDYLNENFQDKITLSYLEKRFKINKYKILRNFKSQTGLTPQEYITSLRMENAKKMFFEQKKIVNIALDNGFYDQSHFVHTFKKYVGVTPFSYKSSCNILQEK